MELRLSGGLQGLGFWLCRAASRRINPGHADVIVYLRQHKAFNLKSLEAV